MGDDGRRWGSNGSDRDELAWVHGHPGAVPSTPLSMWKMEESDADAHQPLTVVDAAKT